MDISYGIVLEYEFFATLWKSIWDGTDHLEVFFSNDKLMMAYQPWGK